MLPIPGVVMLFRLLVLNFCQLMIHDFIESCMLNHDWVLYRIYLLNHSMGSFSFDISTMINSPGVCG
jgi:hypothetical protein